MNMFKVLGGLVLAIVLVAAVAVFYVANNINGIVKQSVETLGSEALAVEVSLQSVDIQLLSNSMRLKGLTIANPAGFTEPYIFKMDEVLVDLDIASLLDKVVSVEQIIISGTHVVAEQKGLNTNLQALQKGLASSSAPKQSSPAQKSDSKIDVLVKVGLFRFADSSTRLLSDRWGDRDIQLSTIELTNIGGNTGVPPEKLAEAVLKPLIKQLNDSLEKQLKDLLEGKAKAKLKEKEDELKSKLDAKLKEKLGSDEDVDALKSLLSR
jgi:uncharacterized protein involved in outer membrane biogenesis